MTGKSSVNGSGNRARSGAQTLVLLAAPLNCLILRALAKGPRQQAELLGVTRAPAQTTLRAQLKKLLEAGAVEKHRRNHFPGMLEYELTTSGRDLLLAADVLEDWLVLRTDSPLLLGGGEAKAAIKVFAEAWSSGMLRALAAGPLSLTELDGVISSLSYPALERRLGALRLAGLIEARPSETRGTPYGVTEWLRRGVAPLSAAACWERRHRAHTTTQITRLDIEAAFLLAVPILSLPSDQSGSCRLSVELRAGHPRKAAVVVDVGAGAIDSCATNLDRSVDAWALGPTGAWLSAVGKGRIGRLELGGDRALAANLVGRLHEALFQTNIGPALTQKA